jgi:integrase
MQRGKIYKHGGQWLFRYKIPAFVAGAKVWKDAYEKLAPVEQYNSAAQVEKDFARKLNELRGSADSSKFTPAATQLLADFIEHVYFAEQASKLKPSTLYGYKHVFARHIKPLLTTERMVDFRLPTAQKFIDRVAESRPLSSTTLHHVKWFLKAVFDVARAEEVYDSSAMNPFQEVKCPKGRKQKQPTRYATLDQVLDMIDALEEPAATVVACAAFSGLRKSEIQGLRWEDLKGNELHVQRTAWRTTDVRESTKTDASKASVPVLKILAKHLKEHRDGFPGNGFIFVGAKMGRPLDLHNLANRVIRPALAEEKIPWAGWHGFRRGLATNLHTLGVPDMDIQKILRHADVATTQQSYIKVEDKVRQAAMRKLEKVLVRKRKAREGK